MTKWQQPSFKSKSGARSTHQQRRNYDNYLKKKVCHLIFGQMALMTFILPTNTTITKSFMLYRGQLHLVSQSTVSQPFCKQATGLICPHTFSIMLLLGRMVLSAWKHMPNCNHKLTPVHDTLPNLPMYPDRTATRE